MIIKPNTLSIITTHQCTAACEHCCFSCTPKVKDSIPVDNIHKYIDQATEVDSLKVVVFTGGECFLLGKNLDALIFRASNHGYITRFVSNGYWARTPELAYRRVDRLVRSGLKEANFSTGDHHARYVSPSSVQFGAIACAKADLVTLVVVETFANSKFNFAEFVEGNLEFKSLIDEGKILVRMSPWMEFDGEEELDYTDKYIAEIDKNNRMLGCSTILNVLSINPSEDLIACCGLTLEEIEEVHLGSLKKNTIKEIISQTPDDFIKIWIHIHGPEAIIEYASRYDSSVKPIKKMSHICEYCRYMYANAKIKDIILKHPPPNKDAILEFYYTSLISESLQPKPSGDAVKISRNMSCSSDSLKKLYEDAVN